MAFNNPFNNPFEQFSNPWADIFTQYASSPNPSVSEPLSSGPKNGSEAFSEMVKSVSEVSQLMMRRQVEMAQQQCKETQSFLKDSVSSLRSPETTLAKQAEFLKDSAESNLANIKELSDIASQAASQVGAAMSESFSASPFYASAAGGRKTG